MKTKLYSLFFLSLFFSLACISCQQKQSGDKSTETVRKVVFDDKPFARLEIYSSYNMGHFQRGENIRKSMTIEFKNTGNDTLYVNDVLPDCDCTTILSFESKVAPDATGTISISMDLSEYASGSISKGFSIISNSRSDNVRSVMLNCILD